VNEFGRVVQVEGLHDLIFMKFHGARGNVELCRYLLCGAALRDKPEDFLFISGDDPVTLPMMALGGVGAISVIGNALPRQLSDMVRLLLNGDYKAAHAAHFDLIEFTRLMFAEGSPAGVKTALKQLGICGDTVRLPLVQVSEKTAGAIVEELKKLAPVAVKA